MPLYKENENSTGYEVAVIGMAGRFPGAASTAELWDNLKHGREGIRFFNHTELIDAGLPPDMLEDPHFVPAKAAIDDAEYFDASFFNYTFPEADIMDPQLRLLHQCAWSALEDASYNPDTYDGSIGFYVGSGTPFHWFTRILDRIQNPSASEVFSAASVIDGYSMSTQVAYRLNLKGPAMTIQTACSTSLVAIHAACQALLSGECHMALAGGVSLTLPAKNGYIYRQGMVLSPDGHCRSFDAEADGTISGNGSGIVVLKPLENAINDHDHIYAVVKGTAMNNDGNRRIGYSAPSVKGQAEVIRIAQRAAEVEPESIGYIEAHGSGTRIGDPVEIRALTRAFNTGQKQFCRIGSIKSNIGHLDAAAGVSGFIKTVLSLHHRMIPPSLHFKTPNPEIDFENTPFVVNTGLHPWEATNGSPRRAGVSSFGIGGTNAHVVLEEAPAEAPPHTSHDGKFQVLPVSGKTEDALERNTQQLAQYFETHPGVRLPDAAYTLQSGRKPFQFRRSLVCRGSSEAAKALSGAPGGPNAFRPQTHARVTEEKQPLVFMFSGLGSQYVNMGRGLYRDEPLFRQEIDRCAAILKPLAGCDIITILYPPNENQNAGAGPGQINRPETVQLVIFVFEYALAKLLMGWGISPDSMIGYSFGEYVAASLAGVFSLEDVLKLIVYRGNLIRETRAGAMLSVPLPKKEVLPLLPASDTLSLAIDNGPSCIVAGPAEAVDQFQGELKEKKYFSMRINTSQGIHSPLMDPILDRFEAKFREISLHEPQIPYISNLTGQWITPREATDPHYWVKHLSNTVRFNDGVRELVREPHAIFLEIGPGRDLSAMIQRSLGDGHRVINLIRPPQKDIPDDAYLLDRVGRLWLYGKTIDWRMIHSTPIDGNVEETRCRVPLPTYSFERQPFDLGDNLSPGTQQSPGTVREPVQAPTFQRTRLPDNYEAPGNETEEKVAQAFQTVFGLERIGIHDDFFELGGDSLKVITLVTNIHREMDVDVPMEEVFNHSTVRELARHIGQTAGEHVFSSIPVAEERDYYPMSGPQTRVYIMEQIEEESMAYTETPLLWMDGNTDRHRLEHSYKTLLQHHESLRTGFFMKDGEPVLRIYAMDEIDTDMEFIDLSANGDGNGGGNRDGGEEIKPIVDDFLQTFDLAAPPLWVMWLVKVAEDRHLLLQKIHHIISDDISTGVLMIELSALYRGDSVEPQPIQYNDYVMWLTNESAVDGELKRQETYWLDRFSDAGALPPLAMPFDFPRPELRSFDGHTQARSLEPPEKEKLLDIARANKTTLFILMFTIYNTLLYKYTAQEDITVGIPITGRSHRDLQQVVGMFVNTLALRNFPSGDKTFEGFLHEVRNDTLDAYANQSYQFEDLVEKLTLPRDLSRNPLFDSMFVLHTVDIDNIRFPGVTLNGYDFERPACRFDMTLNVSEYGGGLNMGLEYCTALLKKETVQRFLDDLLTVIDTVTKDPRVKLRDIPSLEARRKEEERKRLLIDFNDTRTDYQSRKTLKECLEDRAAQTPDAVALAGFRGKTAGLEADTGENGEGQPLNMTITPDLNRVSLSYSELNQRANRLARRLKESGAAPGVIIALIAERNIEMIVALIAVLKAGAAYLPIGPEYPPDRAAYMVSHTQAPIILGSASGESGSFGDNLQFIDLTHAIETQNHQWEPTNLETPGSPNDLAYTIFTSGTTGVPKGVMIENQAVVNFIKGITDVIPFVVTDNILSLTTLAFDIFGLETLLPLTKGSTVIVGSMEEQLDASAAAAVILSQQVTILQVTPSRLRLFTSQAGAAAGLMHLNYLLVGGEVFPPPLLEEVRTLTKGKIFNVYGPTETTIWSTLRDVTEGPLNIGKPMANTRVYILDKTGGLQPIGATGELCISGHGVARGYFKDEALTAEKFIQNPFIAEDDPDADGNRRIYRTGDMARWLPEGDIECLGRVDHQVKIRGFRIEPGEIEHRLTQHDAITEAVVLPKEEENGERYLCAYVVPVVPVASEPGGNDSGPELEIPQLREYLAGDLPDYMIPSHFVSLQEIPLNANGKIDRNALLNIKSAGLKRAAYVAPKNEIEEIIANTWKEVLDLEEVGAEDNFFDLGGTSLKIIGTVGKLKEALNRDIPVVTMFRYPTVVSMANFLGRQDNLPKRKDRTEIKKKGRERLGQRRRGRTARRR